MPSKRLIIPEKSRIGLGYGLRAEDFPHSQKAYESTFSLPLYSRMTPADAERVAAVLRGVLAR